MVNSILGDKLELSSFLCKWDFASEKKYKNFNMEILSMGMSGDYETAIECGANLVRIGSLIFFADSKVSTVIGLTEK